MKNIIGLLCTLIVSATFANELPYLDKDFGCTEEATAQKYIADFSINTRSFGGKELCNGDVDLKKLLNDIAIIDLGEFDTTKPSNIFILNSVPADNYYGWTQRMTYGIRRQHDIPHATAYNSGGYFTFQDGWAHLSTLGRVGTFIHEARHTSGYRHYPCDQGPYAGLWLSGCDTGLNQTGSHQVEMEYYSRVVLQGVNFHPVYKSMARLMNLARANFVFNKPALKHSEAILYLTENNTAHLAHPQVNKDYVYDSSLPVLLKRASMGATLFAGTMSYSLDLNDSSQFLTGQPDVYSYFKILYSHNDISDLIDLEEIDLGVQRYLLALDANGVLHNWDFETASWGQKVNTPQGVRIITRDPQGQHGVFIYTADNKLIPVDINSMRLLKHKAQEWPSEISGFVSYNNSLVKLTSTGVLEDENKSALPIQNNQNIKQVINVPIYDAYDYF